MESLTRLKVLAVAGVAAVAVVALVVGSAEGKKKSGGGGGKLTVLSDAQQQILNAGAISVKVKSSGGKVIVDALQAGKATPVTKAKKVKSGKRTVNVPLTSSGRTTMSSCSIDGLQARLKGKASKSGGKGSKLTPLTKDLAACSPPKGPKCDPFDPSQCMQPFPNDYFTVADSSTPTGRRLDFHADQMPTNKSGVPI